MSLLSSSVWWHMPLAALGMSYKTGLWLADGGGFGSVAREVNQV